MKKISLILLCGIILLGICGCGKKEEELSNSSAYEILDILEKHQSDFKDPSSLMLEKAFVCNDLWDVEIRAKNSYGAYTKSHYLIANDMFIDYDEIDDNAETTGEILDALSFLWDQEDCIKEGNDIHINDKDIEIINKRLVENYK